MASLTGAPLHLLGVVDPYDYQRASLTGMFIEPAMIAEALAEDETRARTYLEQVSAGLAPTVPTVEVNVVQGQPARAIVAFCKPGDLLVMASHGRGGVLRFFLGSVAENVVRRATVPVLLVHARQTASE